MGKAFLFPGQASQYVGMGADLYHEAEHTVRAYYDWANDLLSFDLKKVSFKGPAEELKQTRITQPAIFVHSVALAAFFTKSGVKFDAAAGHSLGEYSALVAADAMDFDQALEVVALRGELMQSTGTVRPGAMAAVIGLEMDQINHIVGRASGGKQVVVAANLNAPGQIVISGDAEAVESAMDIAGRKGAKRVVLLDVSGAFHSPLMAPAADKLSAKLGEVEIRGPRVPVYLNVTGQSAFEPQDIRMRLIQQLTSPVRWERTIRNMLSDGIDRFVEIGPGKVLQGLVKRIDSAVGIGGVDTYAEMTAYLEARDE